MSAAIVSQQRETGRSSAVPTTPGGTTAAATTMATNSVSAGRCLHTSIETPSNAMEANYPNEMMRISSPQNNCDSSGNNSSNNSNHSQSHYHQQQQQQQTRQPHNLENQELNRTHHASGQFYQQTQENLSSEPPHSDGGCTSQGRQDGNKVSATPDALSVNKKALQSPLPPSIQAILTEVAINGSCSQLSWQGNTSEVAANASAAVVVASARVGKEEEENAATGRTILNKEGSPFNSSSTSTSSPVISKESPPRKKLKNGIHSVTTAGITTITTSSSRKRPLGFVNSTITKSSTLSENEMPNSTLEKASDKIEHDFETNVQSASVPDHAASTEGSLNTVVREAIRLVLESYYQHRGGYKLSPAEKRQTVYGMSNLPSAMNAENTASTDTMENVSTQSRLPLERIVFQQRCQRIISALDPTPPMDDAKASPPFTIQRIAEVLLAPERYYTQTHKLCNCLEKLLLVSSSVESFGGSKGGYTSQSRQEDIEMEALADEKSRLYLQLRLRQLRRRASSAVADELATTGLSEEQNGSNQNAVLRQTLVDAQHEHRPLDAGSNEGYLHRGNGRGVEEESDSSAVEESRQLLEAAARASLRSKFDHVGIDPHHHGGGAVNNRDVRSIAEQRGMTNSPPPPSLSAIAAASPGISLTGHGSLLRHHGDQDHHGILNRSQSPILFSGERDAIHFVRASHSALAGTSPLEIMALHGAHQDSMSYMACSMGGGGGGTPSGCTTNPNRDQDLESRSSASSDVDSESDDVSFDDSASDRSDGSDSGGHLDFSSARAMNINRRQQQHQQRIRMMNYLQSTSTTTAESDCQSGDTNNTSNVEPMRSEVDSCGSDSSSSDMTD